MDLACLRIDKLRQSSTLSTLTHYLPGSVPVDTEDKHLAFSRDWAATANVIPQQFQGIVI
jgi:hypothetical protein